MARRPLDADDRAAWGRLAATVTPLGGPPAPIVAPDTPALVVTSPKRAETALRTAKRPPPQTPSDTLDGGWDRRLRRGSIAPERSIDLHGHTLATAQMALEQALDQAVAAGTRVLLVVTGKPPRAGEARRGLIRASIFDWIARSHHAAAIAAVRNAHPRHGGAGALYLILRRRRAG